MIMFIYYMTLIIQDLVYAYSYLHYFIRFDKVVLQHFLRQAAHSTIKFIGSLALLNSPKRERCRTLDTS